MTGTRSIIKHAFQGGVDSVFLCGTTGEFLALDDDEVLRIAEASLEVAGADRVIVHLGRASVHWNESLARQLISVGIRRFAAITPYYMPAGDAVIREYYAALVEACVGNSLLAYHFPDRTGVHLTPIQIAELVERLGLDGVKLSGLPTAYLADVVGEVSTARTVYSGSDVDMLGVYNTGGAGVVSGVSAVFPDLFRDLADTIARDGAGVDPARCAEVAGSVEVVGPSIRSLKQALVELGIIGSAQCRMALDQIDRRISEQITALTSYRRQIGDRMR